VLGALQCLLQLLHFALISFDYPHLLLLALGQLSLVISDALVQVRNDLAEVKMKLPVTNDASGEPFLTYSQVLVAL
jgi:hypothetical protein